MRSACSFVIAVVVGCVGFLGATSDANAQDRNRARAAYARGQQLFEAGQYDEAEAAFEEAYRIIPNPVVLLGIAETHVRRGDRGSAVRYLEQYLRESPNASDRREIEERIRELGGAGGATTIVIQSSPSGAEVAINGQRMGRTPYVAEVPTGRYQVQIYRDGFETVTQTVDAESGSQASVNVTLDPVGGGGNGNTYTGILVDGGGGGNAPNAVVWAMIGVTGAALIAATTTGVLALSESNTFVDNPTESSADRTERLALISDISFGLAAAAAITGLVLYFTGVGQQDGHAANEAPAAPIAVSPLVSPEGGGVAATIGF